MNLHPVPSSFLCEGSLLLAGRMAVVETEAFAFRQPASASVESQLDLLET